MTKQEEKKTPYKKFRIGNITATVWETEFTKDKKTMKFYNTEIVRNYTTEENKKTEWHKTSMFSKQDLNKIAILSRKVEEFLFFENLESNDEDEDE